MKNLVVIDGQGGRIGKLLIEKVREASLPVSVTAVGANSLATSAMLKAGADAGATGENAVCYNAARADIIAGPVGVVMADAMLGEITPAMAAAVGRSDAKKVLIPFNQGGSVVAGTAELPVAALIKKAVELIAQEL